MDIKIREPILENLDERGIPVDFASIMNYFNRGLQNKNHPCYRFMPRQTPISLDEIRNLWIPSLKTNLNYLAEQNGKVIGAATVLFDPNSNEYEHRSLRAPGTLSLTTSPDVDYKTTAIPLIERVLITLKRRNQKATLTTPVEFNEDIEIVSALGFSPIERPHEPYKDIGLSGRAAVFQFP